MYTLDHWNCICKVMLVQAAHACTISIINSMAKSAIWD